FYQIYAYFNNVPERGKAFKYGNSPPVMPAPTPDQERVLAAHDARLAAAEATLRGMEPEIARGQAAWEKTVTGDWAWTRTQSIHLPLASDLSGTVLPDPPKSDQYLYLMENSDVAAKPVASVAMTPLWKDGTGEFEGRVAAFDGKRYIEIGGVAN